MKKLIHMVFLLCICVIISLQCDNSTSQGAGGFNLTGWWDTADFTVRIIHDSTNNSISLEGPMGDEFAAGTISGNTISIVDDEENPVELTYHNSGDYIDGNDPKGNYIKFTRVSAPPFISLVSRTITIDGNITDWSGITPQLTDTGTDRTDCIPAADIESLSVCTDGDYLVFLLDLAANAVFPHSGHANQEKYQIRIDTNSGNFYELDIISLTNLSIHDSTAGTFTTIGAPGVSGDRIECRVSLSTIGNPVKISVNAGTWSDVIDDDYDETREIYIQM